MPRFLFVLFLLIQGAMTDISKWSGGCPFDAGAAKAHCTLYIQTVSNGAEAEPTWADCSRVYDLLVSHYGSVYNWACDLKWGTCGQCFGSCVQATWWVVDLDADYVMTGLFGSNNHRC